MATAMTFAVLAAAVLLWKLKPSGTKSGANQFVILPTADIVQPLPLETNPQGAVATGTSPAQPLRIVLTTNEAGLVGTGFYGRFVKDTNQAIPRPRVAPPPGISNVFAPIISNAFRKYWDITNVLPEVVIHTSSFNGLHSARLSEEAGTLTLLFYSPTGGLSQADRVDFSGHTVLTLLADRSGRLLLYSNRELGEGVRFFPNGTLNYAYWKGPDGREHRVSLSEEGEFIDWR